jgi:hypothetical protein
MKGIMGLVSGEPEESPAGEPAGLLLSVVVYATVMRRYLMNV